MAGESGWGPGGSSDLSKVPETLALRVAATESGLHGTRALTHHLAKEVSEGPY